ncbi:M23 family metallopeptidase [Paractinoplanes durhamensis]|uniref:M23ase beta-sheet core domain-containing protein n=1 Tax=Paractinoplanes durhamensis TaxID=113563 RepID=A0ABQ3YX33_9ACTN|nr:M23 family metallopeptidase [Actinoplanes durhamensis]GIE02156.1 hypothetical protein Adu01nite_35060 [Actinoplanes durhamensis]
MSRTRLTFAAVLSLFLSLIFAGPAHALPAKPRFQLPFPCGQSWSLFSYAGHNPADRKIDMQRIGGTTLGSPVVAALGGTVHEWFDPGGLEIDHGNGWFTVYLHMRVRSVSPGTRVAQGQKIGEVGNVGTTDPHLHYELLYDSNGNGDGENGEIVTAAFNSVDYNMGASGQNSYSVTSHNCGASPQTVGYYNAGDATFHLSNTNASGSSNYAFGFGPVSTAVRPVVGDWNGDGKDSVGYYDTRDATFHLSNALASGSSDYAFGFGPSGSAIYPVTGDWNGDGKDSVGYYDSRDATFHLSDALASGSSNYAFGFGPVSTAVRPVVGDWNNDGKDSVGYYDTRDATFHLSNDLASGSSDYAFGFGPASPLVQPVTGDFDGNGSTTIGYHDTRDATFHLSNSLSSGSSDLAFGFGPAGAAITSVFGDWNG